MKRRLFHRPNARIGATLIVVMLIAAAFGVMYTPYDPIINNLHMRLVAPSALHWLGTDEWGRDVFSRLLNGASVSVLVSVSTVLVSVASGSMMTQYFNFEKLALSLALFGAAASGLKPWQM